MDVHHHRKRKSDKRAKQYCKCAFGICLYISILLFVLFLICFVIIPVIFKYSIGFQRSIVFPTWLIDQKNYTDTESFGLKGVKNFYIQVNGEDNVTLGLWEILPFHVLSEYIDNDKYNYDGLLTEPRIKILIYLHGNGHDRTGSLHLYSILRKYFLIIACDYRGYGDSTKAPLTQDGIVDDIVSIYRWLRANTNSSIYIWGHSLGTGVGTEMVAKLKTMSHIPSGLILEAPFTSIIDVVERHPVVKFYSWLPWYRNTLIDPLIENKLNFAPAKYIVDVDCPIMILHAKDDTIIPYDMSQKLYEIASAKRNSTRQGNITFYLFDADLGYDHMWIYSAPELPFFVKKFIEDSTRFENSTEARNKRHSHRITR